MTPQHTRRTVDLFADLLRSQRDLADLMRPMLTPASTSWAYPPANLYQSPEAYVLQLEMPGVDPSTLDIQTLRNEVSIVGERKQPSVPDHVSFHRRERAFGRFRRTFGLPHPIDGEGVQATYRDGVLEVRVPKAPEARPRQIPLTVG